MDVFYIYTYGSAAWLGLQSLVLTVAPSILINAMLDETRHSTSIETYFARALGLALVLIAVILLFFTGTIPLTSSIAEPVSAEDHDPKAPYAVPILYVTTIYHTISTIVSYTRYNNYGSLPFLLGAVGYGGMACLGGWCIMFGTAKARLSKRTGADKRTKGFPFTNVNAYNKKIDRKMG